jgi:hypothetical protein
MNRETCADCKAESPETPTHYTLIAEHGWRLVRPARPGSSAVEWRCPSCWTQYKSRQPARPAMTLRPARAAQGPSDSVEAAKMFDRALQALTTKPPKLPR